MPGLLTESEVIDAVCRYLEAEGYVIEQRLTETQRGDDIIARSADGERELVVEAKGETSSKPHTANFGNPFKRSQVHAHVAKAFFRAAQTVGTCRRSAVALPNSDFHEAFVNQVAPALRKLEIEVLWVLPDQSVKVAGYAEPL